MNRADETREGAVAGLGSLVDDELPWLTVEALSCAAGYRLLFEDLSLTLHRGQWLRLSGPNGSGKTTLLRAIAGLIRPVAGSITWLGHSPLIDRERWQAQMLYQGHAAGWKDSFGALDNLLLQRALDRAMARAPEGEAAEAQGLLERCGLGTRATLAYMRLSAGQRRRLSLARLAGSRHPLWLLDEPTTALDTEGQALFAQLLREHLVRGGCAIIATHLPIDCGRTGLELDLSRHAGTRPDGRA